MSQRSRQSTRPLPSKSAQLRGCPGLAVGDGSRAGAGVFVAVNVGVFVGVLVGVSVGVSVGVGVGVSVGVFVGVGVLVAVLVAVLVGILVGVSVGVLVGVAVGGGPIQSVTLVNTWKLEPVAMSWMVCDPSASVDESRVKDCPVPRNPFWDDDQNSCPRTSGVPSQSAPVAVNVMTVLTGNTAPSMGETILTLEGPTAAADAGCDEPESIENNVTTSAAKAK